jgi:hypothetical protein
MKTNKSKNWLENKEDLRNSELFNICYFGLFTWTFIIGTQHYVLFSGWKGIFMVIIGLIFLIFQKTWQQEKINYWRNKFENEKTNKRTS